MQVQTATSVQAGGEKKSGLDRRSPNNHTNLKLGCFFSLQPVGSVSRSPALMVVSFEKKKKGIQIILQLVSTSTFFPLMLLLETFPLVEQHVASECHSFAFGEHVNASI